MRERREHFPHPPSPSNGIGTGERDPPADDDDECDDAAAARRLPSPTASATPEASARAWDDARAARSATTPAVPTPPPPFRIVRSLGRRDTPAASTNATAAVLNMSESSTARKEFRHHHEDAEDAEFAAAEVEKVR